MNVVATLSLAFLVASAAGRASFHPAQQPSDYCLPQSQLALAGVPLGADSQQVRSVLGPPLRVVRGTSEDDGGRYPVLRLQYPSLDVDIGRNRVELLTTTTSAASLPAGVQMGMTLDEVARRLAIPKAAQVFAGDTLAPILCAKGPHSPDLAGLAMIFDHGAGATRRLTRIILSAYGP